MSKNVLEYRGRQIDLVALRLVAKQGHLIDIAATNQFTIVNTDDHPEPVVVANGRGRYDVLAGSISSSCKRIRLISTVVLKKAQVVVPSPTQLTDGFTRLQERYRTHPEQSRSRAQGF